MPRGAAKAADEQTVEEDAAPVASSDNTAADIQARFDEAHAKGYFGWTPDTIPNERYSLASGPDAPSPAEQLEVARSTTPPKEG